jgi:ParB family transcriptional regulator, chromosome partitioning protein
MAGHKALGRGLDALFNSNPQRATPAALPTLEPSSSAGVKEISVDAIKPNRHQPRVAFDQTALEELAASIRSHGLAQALLVTESGVPGEYELVAGERRLRASKLAGLATVPCVVKKLSSRERFEIALVENMQREDLNALEEALAMDGLMREYALTQEDVAQAIGKSRSAVANTLRLLRLHYQVQDALRAGKISEGHAKVLAGIAEDSEQLRLLNIIVSQNLTVRDLEALVAREKPATKGTPRTEKTVLPEVRRYEEALQHTLGRKVELKTNGTKGHLKIEFYSPSDLDELCQRFGLSMAAEEPTPGS